MSCLLVGAVAMALSGDGFSLEWTHSVEKVTWHEDWRVTPAGLRLTRAAVKGSGAGMEPGPDAVLQGDWWVWHPDMPALPELVLAASGATVSPWRLCDGAACRDLGGQPGAPVVLRPCGDAPSGMGYDHS